MKTREKTLPVINECTVFTLLMFSESHRGTGWDTVNINIKIVWTDNYNFSLRCFPCPVHGQLGKGMELLAVQPVKPCSLKEELDREHVQM